MKESPAGSASPGSASPGSAVRNFPSRAFLEIERADLRKVRHIKLIRAGFHLEVNRQEQERAALIQRATQSKSKVRSAQVEQNIEQLQLLVGTISKFLHQQSVLNAPPVSFLDEIIASLEATEPERPPVVLSQGLINSFSSED